MTNKCVIPEHNTQSCGYALVYYLGQMMPEHRMVFHQAYGIFPEVVHHTCGNKNCVNLSHLLGVTRSEHRFKHYIKNQHYNKQFCCNGHKFTTENTYIRIRKGSGVVERVCRKCKADSVRKSRSKILAQESTNERETGHL